MLVLFHEEAKACVLQAMLNTFLSVIESSIPEIWNMENEAMSTATTPVGPLETLAFILCHSKNFKMRLVTSLETGNSKVFS